MKPFLKWAGGKRWAIHEVKSRLPAKYNRYVEPFLGGAAVFLALAPSGAILSDINDELINAYRVVRDHPDYVYSSLYELQKSHSREQYYQFRERAPSSYKEAAVRFIYLNRTCWNGLYRVNKENHFNVPIGTKKTVIFDDDNFDELSRSLSNADLRVSDFESIIDLAEEGDIIYVDPPYTVRHNTNGFIKYNKTIFSWDDQLRLRTCLERAKARRCHIIVSNANHESVRDLYVDFGELISLPRRSVIAGSSAARGETSELLVVHHG